VLRELFFRAARRFTPTVAATTGYGLMYVPTKDLYVGAGLFSTGGIDADAIGDALEIAEAWHPEREHRRRLVVEIGANIGSTTVPALKRYGFERVVAIEPLPANVTALRLNLYVNDVAERATVLPVALSEADGEMELQVAETNSGDNRLVNTRDAAAPGSYGEDRRDTVTVEVRSWDSLVAEGAFDVADVGLVWIDVQGHEGQVLAGASTLTEAPDPVVIEFWPYGLRRAGGLELLQRVVADRYETIVDLHSHDPGVPPEVLRADQLDKVTARLHGIANTDLVLLPAA
jgi:FkbM family methyltransferase